MKSCVYRYFVAWQPFVRYNKVLIVEKAREPYKMCHLIDLDPLITISDNN